MTVLWCFLPPCLKYYEGGLNPKFTYKLIISERYMLIEAYSSPSYHRIVTGVSAIPGYVYFSTLMFRALCGSSLSLRRSAFLLGACRAFHSVPQVLHSSFSAIRQPAPNLVSTLPGTEGPIMAANLDAESSIGSYDLKARVKLNYTDVTVSKWQSRDSGLTVVHLDYDGTRHAFVSYLSTSHFGPLPSMLW